MFLDVGTLLIKVRFFVLRCCVSYTVVTHGHRLSEKLTSNIIIMDVTIVITIIITLITLITLITSIREAPPKIA